MQRIFEIGHSIWFVLHCNEDGVVTALEEHDHYAGGHVTKPDDVSWGEQFVHLAVGRIVNISKREAMRQAATKFLSSEEKLVKIVL